MVSCLKVNKTWCLYAFSLLWNRPIATRAAQVATISRVFNSEDPSLPYANAVKRINLSAVTHGPVDDHLFEPWKACTRAERLTLGSNARVSARVLRNVLQHMPNLIAVDLAKISSCDDAAIRTLAETCTDLQGLNINGCTMVGDEAMRVVADQCRNMRRVSHGLPESISMVADAVLAEIEWMSSTIRRLARRHRTNMSDATRGRLGRYPTTHFRHDTLSTSQRG